MSTAAPIVPAKVNDRFDVYRFFNGLSEEGKVGIDHGRTRVPLVKTFLLEHVSARTGREQKHPKAILSDLGVDVQPIDDTFFEVVDYQSKDRDSEKLRYGYLEKYDDRFFAYYTAEKSATAIPRVNRWISSSSEIDSPWLSADFLSSLWGRDVSRRGDDRFGKLFFRHDSIFDMPSDMAGISDSELDTDSNPEERSDDIESEPDVEQRRIRSTISDRIGPIRSVLDKLQSAYTPLNALYGLRIPSIACRGGHDLYQEGRITNRSESFEDHRNTGRYLHRLYKSVLELTEKSAWFAFEQSSNLKSSFKGVPLIINFGETLSQATFERWISMAFRRSNAFRLWGNPIRMGPTKVHVYGADRHLWQPINLEISENRLVAILPKGTCGNTFHRLVTNVQRFVCPKIDVWLGSKPFSELMSEMVASTDSESNVRSKAVE